MPYPGFPPPAGERARPLSRRGVVAAAAALPLLAACGGSAPPASTAPSPSTAGGTVRFSFWLSTNTPQAIERVMQKSAPFVEQYPRVTLEPVGVVGNYAEKIVTETAGGSASDAIMVDAYYAQEWYGNGMAVPLDQRMARTKDARPQDYQGVFLEDCSYGGKIYGLPTDAGPAVLAGNPTLFSRATIPNPYDFWKRDQWTLDAFVEAGKKIVALDPSNPAYVFTGASSFTWWLPLIWTFGGEMYDQKAARFVASSAPAIEALQWNRDLMHSLRIVPAPQQNASAQGITWPNQRVAIQNAWPRQPVRYTEEIGTKVVTMPLPAGKKGSIAVTKSNSFIVWSGSKQANLAFELIRAMTGARGEIEEMKAYGFIYPARKDSLESKEFRDLAQWDLGVHRFAADRAHRLPLMREVPWNTLTKVWDDELRKLWNDQVSAKQAAEQITTALNHELAAGRGGR